MPSQNSAVLSGWELSKTVEGSRSATWPLLTTKFQLVSRLMTLGWSERTFVALGICVISYVKVRRSPLPSGPKIAGEVQREEVRLHLNGNRMAAGRP